MTAIPTSTYDLWKTDAGDPVEAHEHDERCGDDCELPTAEELQQWAEEMLAERRAEEGASDAMWGDR